ncbi:carbohydrate-binding family 9-like protein [Flavilitoribacter nigricans]|uniref:carbohydrate-binding family 9-like protein n=1 Tax=Flavilitoribacter nigricans TaxID=70997 RepID=UPI001475FF74|nr:carbohydrate-binding family 9-like protein [Flavilitoribacter nigricans]
MKDHLKHLYRLLTIFPIFLLCNLSALSAQEVPLQVIVIGAHPDDADLCAGGTASLWASMGHNVKFLSLTNGDAGHQDTGGGALAKRRRAEAKESARRLGIAEYEVLDNHDGELTPTLEVRLQVIRRIRRWNADVVILPRPNDYHPDHRNTGLVVQDAAYMVIVPNVASDTPPLEKNPVFLYCQDRFQKPNPFEADIAVNIDPVFEKKVDGLDAHVSQFYEWLPWTVQALDQVPEDVTKRKQWLANNRRRPINPAIKTALEKWYGPDFASEIQNAEAFEICEYGRQPDDAAIRQLFPMLGVNTPSIRAEKTLEPMRIDGYLNESVYETAGLVYLRNSVNKEAIDDPAYATTVQVAYDDTHLYVAFHCPDRDIHSSFSKRDEHLWKEEAVEVFIDTDDEPNNYLELEVSPKNVLYDSYIVDPKNIDVEETLKYNLKGIKTAVALSGTTDNRKDTDHFWTVEMAIPFAEIAEDFHPDQLAGNSWKINFYRINHDASPIEYMAWSPTEGSFHRPERFGRIIFR